MQTTPSNEKAQVMTTAEVIAARLNNENFAAYSLRMGYAMRYDGGRELFETCRTLSEKRNEGGRVIKLTCAYKDGSRLLYSWSQVGGPKVRAIAPVLREAVK